MIVFQTLILSLSFVFFSHFSMAQNETGLDRNQAKKAFKYLQAIRQKTVSKSDKMYKYSKKAPNLPVLVWNDTLAKVAEEKALDMANKNYFGHVDKKGRGINYYLDQAGFRLDENWLDDKKNNYFESLQAGAKTGEDAIRYLIIDKGVPGYGHRKHLLGLDDWNKKHTAIGIAYYRLPDDSKSKFYSYTVVIIAHHGP